MLNKIASKFLSVLLLVSLFTVVLTREAHAYIDLGSGSFLLQMLLATMFASLFAIKVFWQRLTERITFLLAKLRGVKRTV